VTGWPEQMPPFIARTYAIDDSPLFAAPDGRLLVERTPTGNTPGMVYDVFDRRGVRVSRLQLPAKHALVGVGVRSVYTVVTDEDNVQRLQRHPWN
jgi:hypothetical protein